MLKNKRVWQIVTKSIILILAALFVTWVLEYRYYSNDASAAWTFALGRPKVFLYNALLVFFLILSIYGIVRKVFLATAISTALALIIGYIHIAKYSYRGVPIFPEDFELGSQAGTLAKFVDIWGIVRLIIAVVLVIIIGVILDTISKKWLQREKKYQKNIWWRRYQIVSRIAIVALAVTGFLVASDFARNHDNVREINLGFIDSKFTDWNQVINYNDNGFVLGFLYNIGEAKIEVPDGYNKSKIEEIKTAYTEIAKADEKSHPLKTLGYNVVMILNESFFDPEKVRPYYEYEGGDVTPNLHRLELQAPHGTMFSPDYGGGTANIEFEALTGLTNYFLGTVPYTNFLPHQKTVPSLASFAKESNYNTVAIHPFSGGMYKREIVLPKMGFDEFVTEQEMFYLEKDGESDYINDISAYKELFDVLSSSDNPAFVSLITMQNHAPYTPNEYGKNLFTATNVEDEDEKNAIETYLMTLHLSDKYLGELEKMLNGYSENTVILFYGDHSAGVFPNMIESTDTTVSQNVRMIPYLILANFDLPRNADQNLPTTTPNCLGNTLFNVINAKKPAYYYLVDEVCKQEPVLTEAYFGEKAPFMSSTLSSYELLTYDLVAGKQYSLSK